VRDYYELSEIARKKALAFTNASQYVWQKNPELSVAKDYPTAIPGKEARENSIRQEITSTLKNNRDEFALIYFWRPGCPYCDEQKKILKWFEERTGWAVRHININENPALVSKVGVSTVPSIIMIHKGDQDFFPVSAGVITSSELEEKTYRTIRLLKKEVSPEEYGIHDFQRGGGFDVKGRNDWIRK